MVTNPIITNETSTTISTEKWTRLRKVSLRNLPEKKVPVK